MNRRFRHAHLLDSSRMADFARAQPSMRERADTPPEERKIEERTDARFCGTDDRHCIEGVHRDRDHPASRRIAFVVRMSRVETGSTVARQLRKPYPQRAVEHGSET